MIPCIHTLAATLAIAFLAFPAPGFAVEEHRADEARIYELLAGAKAVGENFEQTFGDPRSHDSAPTSYWQGNQGSFGRWKVINDQYCSQWPPNESWACYDVFWFEEAGRTGLVWISSDGQRYPAVLAPKD